MTLRDATINVAGVDDTKYSWAGITAESDATITLQGTNTVKGFYNEYPGVYVPDGNTLTIDGDGALDASSNGWASGIGGGNCGSCGTITIADTVTSVTARKGNGAPYSIGAGDSSYCLGITIGGTPYPDGIDADIFIYPPEN